MHHLHKPINVALAIMIATTDAMVLYCCPTVQVKSAMYMFEEVPQSTYYVRDHKGMKR